MFAILGTSDSVVYFCRMDCEPCILYENAPTKGKELDLLIPESNALFLMIIELVCFVLLQLVGK